MRIPTGNTLISSSLLIILAIAICLWPSTTASAQGGEVYTAMVIASEGVPGSVAGRISIRIVSQTSEDEKKSLLDAFKKSQDDGLALLQTMSKGYINIEGQPGRKINVVLSRALKDGSELVIVGEHVASKLEKWRNVKAADHPLAVIHLRFDANGIPLSGEVFPAVKVTVTPDGFVDVQTDSSNKVTMVDLARK